MRVGTSESPLYTTNDYQNEDEHHTDIRLLQEPLSLSASCLASCMFWEFQPKTKRHHKQVLSIHSKASYDYYANEPLKSTKYSIT